MEDIKKMSDVNIRECAVSDCAYNEDERCRAKAINVGGPSPCCDTYTKSRQMGGAKDNKAIVGACRVQDCRHNKSLQCNATAIHVSGGACKASCMTYEGDGPSMQVASVRNNR